MSQLKNYSLKPSTCSAPQEIQNAILECVKSSKILEEAWFSRANCKSLEITENVSVGIFALWSCIDHNDESINICRKIQAILDNDIQRDIRIPRNTDKEGEEMIKNAKNNIVSNLRMIYDYYKCE